MPTIHELLDRRIGAIGPTMVATRRDLHAHPELGFEEHRTAALVADRLRSLGLEPRTGIGRTGVVADLGDAGPTLLVRADMDGLPIQERSSAPYRSTVPGVMHACGHDGHVAMLLAAAEALVAVGDRLPGRIRLFFQPAEELPPGGARAAIDDGVLDGVDAAVGLHLWSPLPTGHIGVRSGPIMAAHDRLDVIFRGRGGHGGMPESTRDPLVGLAHAVVALQTVISRSVSPLEAAVVTVGTFGSGDAFNVIPDVARLSGSVRSLGRTTRTTVHDQIRQVTTGLATSFGLDSDVSIVEFCPALENDPLLASVGERVAASVVGPTAVMTGFQTMASEDFAFIQARVPGCFLFIGAGRTDGEEVFPHHHPSFDIDEAALPIGARTLARASVAFLEALAGPREEVTDRDS